MKLSIAFLVDVEITRDTAKKILDAWDNRNDRDCAKITVNRGMTAVCDDQDIFFETVSGSSLPLNLYQISRLREFASDMPSEQF